MRAAPTSPRAMAAAGWTRIDPRPWGKPPYAGGPRDEDFPDYVTHWTMILVPEAP